MARPFLDPAGWENDAACAAACREGRADPDWWFPEGSRQERMRLTRAAVAICSACPVSAECLDAHRAVEHGIFGGLGPRRRLDDQVVQRGCAECGQLFMQEPAARSVTCSNACRRDRHLRQMREHHERTTGFVRDHEPTISRYHAGCRCSECRDVSRKKRRGVSVLLASDDAMTRTFVPRETEQALAGGI